MTTTFQLQIMDVTEMICSNHNDRQNHNTDDNNKTDGNY